VTAFFIPGAGRAEERYALIREAAETDMGYEAVRRRIFSLSFRHEGADLEAEVGKPDPVGGYTVLAILDFGRRAPYLIHCGSADGPATQILVSKPVYSETEFAS
jgi:hypothetical protein